MHTGMKETLRRMAELTAIKQDRGLTHPERSEFDTLLKYNMNYWRSMAELENMCSLFYMIEDLTSTQEVCKAIEELEATGKHSYFQGREKSK